MWEAVGRPFQACSLKECREMNHVKTLRKLTSQGKILGTTSIPYTCSPIWGKHVGGHFWENKKIILNIDVLEIELVS